MDMKFFSEFCSNIERFSIECRKTKAKVITLANHKQLEAITCSWRKARENVCELVLIGFGFTSDWMKKWREFFKPIVQRGKRKTSYFLTLNCKPL